MYKLRKSSRNLRNQKETKLVFNCTFIYFDDAKNVIWNVFVIFQTKHFIKDTKCFHFCMFHLPYTIHLVQGTGHPSFSYSTWFVQVTDCQFFEFIVSMGISITSRKRVCQSYSNYKCNFCINPIKGTLFKSWLKMLGKVKKKLYRVTLN